MSHKNGIVQIKVLSRSTGQILPATAPSDFPQIDTIVKSNRFAKFEENEVVLGTFRYSPTSNAAHLMSVRKNNGGFVETTDEENNDGDPVENVVEKDDGVFAGEWIGSIHFGDNKPVFAAANALAIAGGAVNVLLSGPSGFGKTTLPEAFAEATKREIIFVNCATVLETEEWFGYREAKAGDTVFIPTEFTNAIRRGNVVVVLDEFNRLPSHLHNALFPLLDHRRETQVHGETITCGENVIFVATTNIGFQYAGTFVLDAALRNRIDIFGEVSAPPESVEVQILRNNHKKLSSRDARTIISTITALRRISGAEEFDVDFSTRAALKVGNLISNAGLTPRMAFKIAVELMTDEASVRKSITDVLNSKLGMA